MLIEKHIFTKGIDGDTNQRELPQDAMLNLMNGRVGVTEFGRDKRLENVAGTTQITQRVYPPYGVNQCLGSCVDEARNRILFFIWNSFSDHGIYAYDISLNTMYAVLYDSQVTSGLGFSKSYRIDRNCKVVGDLLYWTDNLNPPRRINIEAGIKTNTASYSTTVLPYSYPMTQSVISWIRRPYGLPVTGTKAVDGSFAQNFLADFAGQFSSRLVYRDGEYSVMSTPSAMLNYNLNTDTYNSVTVAFPLTETFDQDVQIIQLAVRYGNSPDYFIVKEWNKGNTSDAAAILAHNVGAAALTFTFYNNKSGIPIGSADSVKPFDNIGLTVKTIEFATNRMFLANYVKGYNTPATTSLSASVLVSGSDPAAAVSLKCYSSWQIGIRFRDNSKRETFVVTNANCIATSADRSYSTLNYSSIAWSLSNAAATTEIPDWAIYYDIVMNKNLRTRSFISNATSNIQYAKKLPDGTYSYQSTYDTSVYAVAIDLSLLNSAGGIGYLFNEGDLCRVYLGNTSTVYELLIIGTDAQYVLMKPQNLGSFSPQPGCIFEIYTPYKQLESEPFYTLGQSYKITNPGLSSRVYSTTSGTITGDIIRYQLLGVRLEAMSPNYNFWQNWFQIYGEENIQNLLGQVNKTNFISWSNVKIIGAQTNGLSTFDALDEKALPLECGAIYKLQLTNKVSDLGQGNIMLAICPTETASLYLGEVQVQGAATTAYIAESEKVIGSINVLNGSRGTINPESVIAIWGLVFGFDSTNGVVWQYSPNGLEDVSRYKMSRFFKNYAKGYLSASTGNLDNINGFHHTPFGVDPFNKEIVCGLPGLIYSNYANTLPSYTSVPAYASSILNRFDIADSLQKDMIFKFEENIWGSNFNYGAEMYETAGNIMYGWKNGAMWSFGTNTTNWNTFFGTQQPLRLCFTANFNPSLLKVLNNIAIEGNQIAPGFTVALTAVPNQQITDLAYIANSDVNDWVNDEGVLYAPFFADRLDPNASGTADQKLYTGSPLRDFSIFVQCEWQVYDQLLWIRAIDIGFSSSRGQGNIVNTINK